MVEGCSRFNVIQSAILFAIKLLNTPMRKQWNNTFYYGWLRTHCVYRVNKYNIQFISLCRRAVSNNRRILALILLGNRNHVVYEINLKMQ